MRATNISNTNPSIPTHSAPNTSQERPKEIAIIHTNIQESQRNKRAIKPHAALVALLAEIRPLEELERGGGEVRARGGPVVCVGRAGAVAEDGEAVLEDGFEGFGGEEVVVGAVCFALCTSVS